MPENIKLEPQSRDYRDRSRDHKGRSVRDNVDKKFRGHEDRLFKNSRDFYENRSSRDQRPETMESDS